MRILLLTILFALLGCDSGPKTESEQGTPTPQVVEHSPDDWVLVTAALSGRLTIRDVRTGEQLHRVQPACSRGRSILWPGPDGVGYFDCGEHILVLHSNGEVTNIEGFVSIRAVSGDGTILFGESSDGTMAFFGPDGEQIYRRTSLEFPGNLVSYGEQFAIQDMRERRVLAVDFRDFNTSGTLGITPVLEEVPNNLLLMRSPTPGAPLFLVTRQSGTSIVYRSEGDQTVQIGRGEPDIARHLGFDGEDLVYSSDNQLYRLPVGAEGNASRLAVSGYPSNIQVVALSYDGQWAVYHHQNDDLSRWHYLIVRVDSGEVFADYELSQSVVGFIRRGE